MGKFEASAVDTKMMMLPSYLTQQGIYKGKKKKERKIQYRVTVTLQQR